MRRERNQIGAGVEVPDSLRKGKTESSGFVDVLVHPHCQLDWT